MNEMGVVIYTAMLTIGVPAIAFMMHIFVFKGE